MPGKSRHIDGTQRSKTRPSRLTGAVLIARWLEREVLRLKKLGVSFAAAADMITQAAHGDRNGVQLPDANVVTLPPNYSVTAMGCCKALQRALNREPAQAAEDYREVDTRRLEDWVLNLAARIQKGDTEAIKTALNLIKHKAELNGYAVAPQKQFENSNRINVNVLVSDQDAARIIGSLVSRVKLTNGKGGNGSNGNGNGNA